MKHAHVRKTESTLRRDWCSRHQWLHSHETSRVYVQCSRTDLMQEGVRSAVPRTTPMMRTGYRRSSAGRVDEASSREYAPQKPDRSHTRASVPLWTAISEASSPTLSVLAEGGTGMCCLQCVWEIVCLTEKVSSSSIPSKVTWLSPSCRISGRLSWSMGRWVRITGPHK
jgi:hypothetical protein